MIPLGVCKPVKCNSCGTTAVAVASSTAGAMLVLEAKHHGGKHRNVIPLADLVKMAAELRST